MAKTQVTEKKWILSDLDGVIMGRMREKNDNDKLRDYMDLLNTLKKINYYELVFLTDRGVEQLAPLVYMLNASTIHGGESGAAAYFSFPHRAFVNPSFSGIAKKISEIRSRFEEHFCCHYPLEPGVLTSIRVERVNGEDLADPYNFLSAFTDACMELTISDHEDCVSLKPKEINKKIGINWLSRLYTEAGNPIDYSNSIWIGDGVSDICAAEFVQSNGGEIAGVANSHPDYAQFITDNKGFLAKNANTQGMVEILNNFLL